MWRLWTALPSPDARGYWIFSIGAYWVAGFVVVYLVGAALLLATLLLDQGWPIWVLISTGMFIWSLPFFLAGVVVLLIGLRMARA
jgi:hypothetical protein